MPSESNKTGNEHGLAARFLRNATGITDALNLYLGARLANTGIPTIRDLGVDKDIAEIYDDFARYCKQFTPMEVGPVIILPNSKNKKNVTRVKVNELLIYPSIPVAKTLAAWLSKFDTDRPFTKYTFQFIRQYNLSVSHNNLSDILVSGARLSDALDEDWEWQCIGLKYLVSRNDLKQLNEQMTHVMNMPRERSIFVEHLVSLYQSVLMNKTGATQSLELDNKEKLVDAIRLSSHLPWAPKDSIAGQVKEEYGTHLPSKSFYKEISEAAEIAGPSGWFAIWQAVASIPGLKRDKKLQEFVSRCLLALCQKGTSNDLSARAFLYNLLIQYFFYRIEVRIRGLAPEAIVWFASYLAADIEAIIYKSELDADNFAESIKDARDREHGIWTICAPELGESGIADVFITQGTLWKLAVNRLPKEVRITKNLIPSSLRGDFAELLRESILYFPYEHGKGDGNGNDKAFNFLDSPTRISEWASKIDDATLDEFVDSAQSFEKKYEDTEEILEGIRSYESLEEVERLTLLIKLRSARISGAVRLSELISLINGDDWSKRVLESAEPGSVDPLFTAIGAGYDNGDRDAGIQVAHWAVLAWQNTDVNEEMRQVLLGVVLNYVFKYCGYSALRRLYEAAAGNNDKDTIVKVNGVIGEIERQAPQWLSGRARISKLMLLPLIGSNQNGV